jgi:hypothetical protein
VFETTVIDDVTCFTPKGKRELLRQTMVARGLRVFIETGTYRGDTVEAMLDCPCADRVVSVELDEDLCRAAQSRFRNTRAEILWGNSGVILRSLLAPETRPALFWLDAHPGEPGTAGEYGQCPLRDELKAALFCMDPDSVILIDDARLFHEEGWPSLAEVEDIATGWHVSLANDIVMVRAAVRA